ncbi:DUF1120 domain-containing protein [Enterobacter hormaechei]|uniref:DUF1120 domain-containing protein n=1 Tax=Enterobacter hormaechei TaxID=158836 RepID=UPI0015E50443|nr:DUF1120 domain-containing protein [Enterobacter hormaechei]MBA8066873.1 DUF1120 domain-containing protein [Enterobacter hormaechei]QLP71216.1 DUF1120 domain-containing protein [Enterobacter hormaechei]QLP80234.1 DUF1120 domain-containing protein [Enterobacter hormaechei]
MGEISVKTGNNARNGGKNSLNRLIRCVCGKKIGPDPRNFNQRVSLGRNDLLIRTFLSCTSPTKVAWTIVDDRADSMQTGITLTNVGWSNSTSWSDSNHFGVGKTAGGVNLGVYAININASAVTADGLIEQGLHGWTVPGNGNAWAYMNSSNELVKPSEYIYTVALKSDALSPMSFSNAVFPLRVSLAIQGTDTLAITDDTNIDGQATISLVYL